ncbi:DUF2789 domain-containing protein [Roseateles terrae]|uniref:DUF2789 domain-containing protein n=1 Tax=Roseateles terrae TaxID=431060 RepID=A0ABR6GLT0_9BURK|nr:DUF2789 domain-containing protein [Roseateles terrae]MBB3193058.1 hypothetical protein [Roseateles terrae]OWQ89702.1 hypothetical protein CDN98_04080 [Roseateles terrae]
MEPSVHPFAELFDQLGLPSSESEIQSFIDEHRPLPNGVKITEAPFWTPSQSRLLKDLLLEDADWAEVVDQLNLALH